ncbi:DUF4386 domain-containing protein [Dactylosporangium sp. NPDC051485]|uniref:DUF4386 domain-containing protein n=1 Tax=Dactylosporangium sp. NPDC051485 TaxID=3154846 RepID=UPI00343A302F
MSPKTTGRIVGALYLLAFLAYGGGGALAIDAHGPRLSAGAVLMLLNSVIVVATAVLVFPLLRPRGEGAAAGYLAGRTVESALCAVGVALLLTQSATAAPEVRELLRAGNDSAYQIGMLAAGSAGIVFCRALLRTGLVPRWLAGWGLAGYPLLQAGAVCELFGRHLGVAFSVPGGLFEVTLGVLLLARGFRAAAPGRAGVAAAYA